MFTKEKSITADIIIIIGVILLLMLTFKEKISSEIINLRTYIQQNNN